MDLSEHMNICLKTLIYCILTYLLGKKLFRRKFIGLWMLTKNQNGTYLNENDR